MMTERQFLCEARIETPNFRLFTCRLIDHRSLIRLQPPALEFRTVTMTSSMTYESWIC